MAINKLLIILFLFSFSSLGSSQALEIFNFNSSQFKGKIKNVEIEDFRARIDSNSTIIYTPISSSLLPNKKVTFAGNGDLATIELYLNKRDSTKLVKHTWRYHYSNGRLDSVQKVDEKYPNNVWRFNYNWVSKDSVISISKLGRTSKVRKQLVTFKRNQEIVEYYGSNGIIHTKEISTFDTLKRKIRFEVYKGNELRSASIHNYLQRDSMPFANKYSFTISENKVKQSHSYFNKNNHIIRLIVFKPNGDVNYEETYKYEYDEIGNWVQKEFYNWEGQLRKITKRKIEYYE